ncbi:hypothetical protein GCM10011321_04120 [Youhaiella tibetensis]|uniref:DUF3828 domain-containing protein n=1 Tax=Paradevosia tibetensis TaxID=1447062 RepID=A0A5B9DPR0_9HYPH|nr:DUF3828 domain-containing protein [Youhaiella tibetensis]QEE21391.1 DUF3828 domain-containing protein [Youhaiella tibetensis]GGF15412.1 hypothetical protein GCM10011321_04120 [Youhaiella tibetensis]
MRLVLAALGFILAMAAPALAATYDSPKALLDSIYESYSTNSFPEDSEEIYSAHLKRLFAADRERTPEGEVGALDFDPFINAQDYDLADLVIGEPEISGTLATSTVRFANFGEKNTVVISMVKEPDGWKVDNVQSIEGEVQWTLTEILGEVPTVAQ